MCGDEKLTILIKFGSGEEEARTEDMVEGVAIESDYSECSSAAERNVSCCRSLALAVSTIYIYLLFFSSPCFLINQIHILLHLYDYLLFLMQTSLIQFTCKL